MEHLDENKALVRRYVATYNAQNLAALSELFAPTYIDHAQSDGEPQSLSGLESKKQALALHFKSYPNSQLTIEDLIAEGDKVAARLTMSGAQKKALPGGHPQGGRFDVSMITIFFLQAGLIMETWDVYDVMTMLQYVQGSERIEESSAQREPVHPKPSVASPQGSHHAPASTHPAQDTKYWARWNYSPEEWRQFDRLDWGRATRRLLLISAGALIVAALLAVYFTLQDVAFTTFQILSLDFVTHVLFFVLLFLAPFALLVYFISGRDFQEARKRHLMRKTGSRRVTIGRPSSFSDQGVWLAETFVPLQETFLRLKRVEMTNNPPLLHFWRTHIEIHQSSWHDTVRILVPRGHEAEAAKLVERFRTRTINSNKNTPPLEP